MGYFLIFTVMINILGTYECKADSKGRIMLPAPLKKQISSVLKEGFVQAGLSASVNNVQGTKAELATWVIDPDTQW